MNQLRQLMLEELHRRNFADTTVRTYLHGVAHFSRYFRRPPDQLGPEDIRKYQAMLFTELKFSPNTVILRLAALRFFYIHVLKRGWSIAETPYPKKVRHLPQILSQEEVARLIDAADTPFHRILLMTLYATGARRAEAAHLKVSDIDSQRMVVHIREGKGGKDRDVMLSPKLLSYVGWHCPTHVQIAIQLQTGEQPCGSDCPFVENTATRRSLSSAAFSCHVLDCVRIVWFTLPSQDD